MMMDCGDGFRRADNGSWGGQVAVKTADYTILENDPSRTFSNRGAAGAINITLPKPLDGRRFSFLKPTQQNIVITATNGAKINGGTANKKWSNVAAEAGGMTTLIADGTDWFVVGSTGTWANDNT